MIVLQVNQFLNECAADVPGSGVCASVVVVRSLEVGDGWFCHAGNGGEPGKVAPLVWLGSARDSFRPREFASLDSVWTTLSRVLPPGVSLWLTVRKGI